MKTKLILIIITLHIQLVMSSQAFNWAIQFGGSGYVYGTELCLDANNNIYSAGNFGGVIDFDPTANILELTSSESSSGYIAKLDQNSNIIWVKQFDGDDQMTILSIKTDLEGNVYATGYFTATVDFDPGLQILNVTSTGDSDAFVVKLNPNGNLLWVKTYQGLDSCFGIDIAIDLAGGVFTVGHMSGVNDFDPNGGNFFMNPVSNGVSDIFITKMDALGNLIWAKQIAGEDAEFCKAIDVNSSGEICIVGNYLGLADFDPGVGVFELDTFSNESDVKMFVCKLSNDGDFLWAKAVASIVEFGAVECASMTMDNFGNSYITGYISAATDFDPNGGIYNLESSSFGQSFVLKLDTSGQLVWAKAFTAVSEPSQSGGSSIVVDNSGNVYTAGHFFNTIDVDPGTEVYELVPVNSDAFYYTKLDAMGNFVWAVQIANNNLNMGNEKIVIDNLGGIYTTGILSLTLDLDPSGVEYNLTSTGIEDTFILKLQCTFTSATINANACNTYTSPSGNHTWTTSGTYTDVLLNTAGCDSVITINLTIDDVNFGITSNGTTLTANTANATYQWVNCMLNLPIPNATLQSYSAIANGSYGVVVSLGACADTSTCVSITEIGVSEIHHAAATTLYPNPTFDELTIETKNISKTPYFIKDPKGSFVIKGNTIGKFTKINLESLDNGIYFLQIGSEVLKFVKQ